MSLALTGHSRQPMGGCSCQGHISRRVEAMAMRVAPEDPPCLRKEFLRSGAVRCPHPCSGRGGSGSL